MFLFGKLAQTTVAYPTSAGSNALVVSSGSAVSTLSNNYVVSLYSNTVASTVGATLLATSNVSGNTITFPNALTVGNYYYTVVSASNTIGLSPGVTSAIVRR